MTQSNETENCTECGTDFSISKQKYQCTDCEPDQEKRLQNFPLKKHYLELYARLQELYDSQEKQRLEDAQNCQEQQHLQDD